MKVTTEALCELYRRKQYENIPIGKSPKGSLFYLSPKQLQAIRHMDNPEVDFVGYGGSARSGKTLLECFVAIFDCLSYDGVAWFLARKELTRLKASVMITMFKLLEYYGVEYDKDFKFDGQENKIKFKNGSSIKFIDSRYLPTDPLYTRYGGHEYTRGGIDESNESEELAIITLKSRTGWAKNIDYKINACVIETFNPDKGHINRRYWKPYKDGVESTDKKFVPALPSDNPDPAIDDWIKSVIKTGDKIQIERLVKGNFDYEDDNTVMIPYDAILGMFGFEYAERGQKYISADIALGGADLFVVGVWDGLQLLDVIVLPKCEADEVLTVLKDCADKHQVPYRNIVFDGDGVGGYLRGFLRRSYKFNNGSSPIIAKKKQSAGYMMKKSFITPDHANLKTQCAYKLADLASNGEIGITLTNTIRKYQDRIQSELQQLKRDKVDNDSKLYIISKEQMKENLAHSPDFLDMMIMRMVFELEY